MKLPDVGAVDMGALTFVRCAETMISAGSMFLAGLTAGASARVGEVAMFLRVASAMDPNNNIQEVNIFPAADVHQMSQEIFADI